MTAFFAISRVTFKETLRWRRAIGLLILSGSTSFMFFMAALSSRGNYEFGRNTAFDAFVGMTIGTFMNIVVPVVTLIIATSVLGDERRDNTMSFLVLRPIRRITIAGAKIFAAFVESFAMTGVGALALGLIVALRIDDYAYIVPLLVATAVATAAYAAVFVPLGYLLKRATLIGLSYVFIWENGIGAAVPAVAGISPWRIGLSAMSALAPDRFVNDLPTFATGSITPGAGGAVLKALVLIALSAGLITLILRRRDLAGGSS
jgi:ABC-2 type transport system permease protein